MATFIQDPEVERRLQAERAASGADRYDEVWEGIYMMAPMPNDRHQEIVSRLVYVLEDVIGQPGLGKVRPGVNVSDRIDGWKHNYRVPDVAVFLVHGSAVNHGAFWHGGPDFVAEVISPDDSTREKIPFYSMVGVKELLLIDRDPWTLELLRPQPDGLAPVASTGVDGEGALSSAVVPLRFRLISSDGPAIEVAHTESDRVWQV